MLAQRDVRAYFCGVRCCIATAPGLAGVGAALTAGRLIDRERERKTEAREKIAGAWKRLERRGRSAWA